MKTLERENYRKAAWKNGLGYTAEIAIHPEGASLKEGNFLWRLSSARIEKASAFSEFPFHDRILVILEGEGIRLSHSYEPGEPPETLELPALEAYEFPGDVPSRCELLGGPVTDLSVFFRKGECEARAEVLRVHRRSALEWVPEGRWNFVYAIDADLEVILGQKTRSLSCGNTLELTLNAPLAEGECVQIRSERGGSIVAVSLS